MLRVGDILEGKYKILEKIGQGGMSRVWLAMDTKLNKQWAVKEINKRSEEYVKTVNEHKTLTEIDIMKKLSHPSLPRIVSVIDEPGSLCVVMDYIEGESLDAILKYYGEQPEDIVVAWTLEICDVLDYLHHQNPPIIYRDMKPSNVMLSPEGHIKIIDFGIAREYTDNKFDTLPLGTRGFASPEHFSQKTDARSDVYTVGVTMYQLLTGKNPAEPPYKLLPLREVNPSLSTGLEKIISKATMPDPDERYQSIKELANAVNSYRQLDDEHIEELEKKIKSFKRRLIATAALLVTGIVLVASGSLLKVHNYNALMNSTTMDDAERAEELRTAIELKPASKDAYLELIKVYANDGRFTEMEANDFLETYSSCRKDLEKDKKQYAEINYAIGEAFLKYYTGTNDNSARAKLQTAETYFQAANVKGFSKQVLAEDYVFMAEFYKSYVLADDSLIADDAGKEDYEELLSKCNSIVTELNKYDGDGKDKMMAITYQVVLNLIDDQRNNMAAAGISKDKQLEVLENIKTSIAAVSDEEAADKINEQIKSLQENINISYQAAKKEEKSNGIKKSTKNQ